MDRNELSNRKRWVRQLMAVGLGSAQFARHGGSGDDLSTYPGDIYSARLGALDSLAPGHVDGARPLPTPAPSPALSPRAPSGAIASFEGQLDDIRSEVASQAAIWTLQAIVEKVSRGPEGYGIEVVEPAWNFILEKIARDSAEMHSLNAEQWEQMLAAYYTKEGFNVVLTPRSGDQGRDLIAELPGRYTVRILEQMKAYRRDRTVSAEEVAGFMHTVNSDRRATHGIITTTAKFAPLILKDARIAPHVGGRLTLVDGTELRAKLLERWSKRS